MLSVTGIHKAFPGVQALAGVDLDVRAGEIHALVGENGAGKSTLTKIIAGVQPADSGEIQLNGHTVHWQGPAQAKAAGIHVIYQEFVLFPHMSVAENVFLGRMPRNRLGLIDHRAAERRAADILTRLGVTLDVRQPVSGLSVADQQMVEIAKAMIDTPKVLILDEPTAVIAGREVELLFDRLRKLRDEGVAIIYISHRLEEIFNLCDRLTVIKDGRYIATRPIGEVTRDALITLMVGRDLSHLFPPREASPLATHPEVVLSASDIRLGSRVRGCSIALRAGIITGLAGMVGSGRSELAMAIFGGLPMEAGTVTIAGQSFRSMTPARAIGLGIGFVTEDRKGQGLAMLQTVGANITAASLGTLHKGVFLDAERERELAQEDIAAYQIACQGPATPVATMSGGNQQKVLLARWARACHRVLILDEPTRGVDVGARTEIYRIMRNLTAQGIAILMISSELPEIVGMSDRVYVMREGVITGVLESDAISEETVMDLATHERQAALREIGMSAATLPAAAAKRRNRVPEQVIRLGIVVVLIFAIIVLGCAITDRFGRANNFFNIYEQSTDLALVSLGQTLTILTGGIDLSVGSMISLLSVLTSGLINSNGDMVIPVCAGVILLGLLIGIINGLGIVVLRVHPLIVTLGMGAILQGVALLYTLAPAGGVPDGFDYLAYGRVYDISVGATIVVVVYLLASLLLRRTATGRYIYAIGDDRPAAILLGLPVKRTLVLVYALSGFFCALTAIYLVARFGTGQPYAGADYTLASVTPVVVGGTMLSGGRGGVIGTLLGAYLIALLNNFLNFLHVSSEVQLVVQGLIIMLAVSVYRERRRIV